MPEPITILWVVAVFLAVLVLFYLSPFFMSPIIKRAVNLWGFYLGKRKRKVLLSYAPDAKDVKPDDLERLNEKLKLEAQHEFAMLDERVKQEESLFKQEVEEMRKRIKALEDYSEKRKAEMKQDLLGKAFDKTKEQFSKDTGKNILL